jgi:hypothetical protein
MRGCRLRAGDDLGRAMALPLDADILRSAYDYLAETPPFRAWNLPAGEDVRFKVIRDPNVRGLYWRTGKRHHIAISSRCIGRTESLMATMAHEMIHLHETNVGVGRGAEHSGAFQCWAARVCRFHGFDHSLF